MSELGKKRLTQLNKSDELVLKKEKLVTEKAKEIYVHLKEKRMFISWLSIMKDAINFVDVVMPEFKNVKCKIIIKRLRDNVYNRLKKDKKI